MAATPLQAEKIHKPTARSGRTRWNRGARRRRGAILTIALIVLVIAGVGAIQDALVEHVGGTVVGDVASDAYGVWGFVLAVTGDQPRAIEAYSRALRLSPKSVALYYLRGLARTLHGDHAAAIDDYTAVAELNPSLVVAYRDRGVARARMADYQGAIADYTLALSVAPTYAAAYYERGRARYRLGDLHGALEELDRALGINAEYVLAYTLRGFVRAWLGDADGALADYSAALERNTDITTAHFGWVVELHRLGDAVGARAGYAEGQRLRPVSPESFTNRGLARAAAMRDQAGALADLQRAADLFGAVADQGMRQRVLDAAKGWQSELAAAGVP